MRQPPPFFDGPIVEQVRGLLASLSKPGATVDSVVARDPERMALLLWASDARLDGKITEEAKADAGNKLLKPEERQQARRAIESLATEDGFEALLEVRTRVTADVLRGRRIGREISNEARAAWKRILRPGSSAAEYLVKQVNSLKSPASNGPDYRNNPWAAGQILADNKMLGTAGITAVERAFDVMIDIWKGEVQKVRFERFGPKVMKDINSMLDFINTAIRQGILSDSPRSGEVVQLINRFYYELSGLIAGSGQHGPGPAHAFGTLASEFYHQTARNRSEWLTNVLKLASHTRRTPFEEGLVGTTNGDVNPFFNDRFSSVALTPQDVVWLSRVFERSLEFPDLVFSTIEGMRNAQHDLKNERLWPERLIELARAAWEHNKAQLQSDYGSTDPSFDPFTELAKYLQGAKPGPNIPVNCDLSSRAPGVPAVVP